MSMLKTNVSDGNGGFVMLNGMEQATVTRLQKDVNEKTNSLGFEINITSLTAIMKRIVTQKFADLPPADYIPIRVGEGSWSTQLTTYTEFSIADNFETGLINTGSDNSRMANADAGVDSITVPVVNWAKQIGWSLFDLKFAANSGNWDLVTAKERARKKNWDLGVQRTAFLGLTSNSAVKGLLTQSGITSNTTLITQYIKSMSSTQFDTLVQGLVDAYRVNCQRTAMPNRFYMPESDYNGLASPFSTTFPNVTKYQYLLDAFKLITRRDDFKIMPCYYADQSFNAAVINKNRYTLMTYDEDTIRMDVPVDYSNTLQNTINGFNFQNIGYGQVTGAQAYRSREILYLDWNT